ncbi:hypothetical protein MMC20_006925 [Loxospora ochrophaea]|nr:hypothetical protein [Loxospora ochrophaea]
MASSPTAKLLRTSRLFSLPPPLPSPSLQTISGTARNSDTATLPYPTQAAIETTPSSLSRGDWGLKRPLPRHTRKKATSSPAIRVNAVDSIDHVTDYQSATDHTLTLRKWQEMGIPITQRIAESNPIFSRRQRSRALSVFESTVDNTATDGNPDKQRWKFSGPWLAGMSSGEFQAYIAHEIKRRRPEFHQFVRTRLHAQRSDALKTNAGSRAHEKGEEHTPPNVTVTDDDFAAEIKSLRADSFRLNRLIWEFLDLPFAHTSISEEPLRPNEALKHYVATDPSDSSDLGPPRTHPSAGLSYLRTSAHIFNHPVLGPQAAKPPIPARILQPQTTFGTRGGKTVFGVAGVVAEEYNPKDNDTRDKPRGWYRFAPDIPGGPKVWMLPQEARITPQGRIKLGVDVAQRGAVEIWEGPTTEKAPRPEPAPPAYTPSDGQRSMPRLDDSGAGAAARQRAETQSQGNSGRLQGFSPNEVSDDLPDMLQQNFQSHRR